MSGSGPLTISIYGDLPIWAPGKYALNVFYSRPTDFRPWKYVESEEHSLSYLLPHGSRSKYVPGLYSPRPFLPAFILYLSPFLLPFPFIYCLILTLIPIPVDSSFIHLEQEGKPSLPLVAHTQLLVPRNIRESCPSLPLVAHTQLLVPGNVRESCKPQMAHGNCGLPS